MILYIGFYITLYMIKIRILMDEPFIHINDLGSSGSGFNFSGSENNGA